MWEIIGGGIHEYNAQQAGDSQAQMLCPALSAPEGGVARGLIGETHRGWLTINLLFVKEEPHRPRYGHRLLTMAEEEARRRGATHAYLDTFSFQAPEFYRRHGYEVYGELNEFPPGHRRYWMRKRLQGGAERRGGPSCEAVLSGRDHTQKAHADRVRIRSAAGGNDDLDHQDFSRYAQKPAT